MLRYKKLGTIVGLVIVSLFLLGSTSFGQTWTALPPYNFLWALWSPSLSPDTTVIETDTFTPIITDLTNGTILPIQPGLTDLVVSPSWSVYYPAPYFYPAPYPYVPYPVLPVLPIT